MIISSALTINNNLNDLTNISVFVGILGIVSGILFFIKQYNLYYLATLWIILQIPYLIIDGTTYDFSQFFNFHVSMRFGSITLGVNAQIIFLLLLKYLILSQYLKQKIIVKPFTEKAKKIIENQILFEPENIVSSKRLSSKIDLEIENKHYSKLLFEPLKSDRIKKAGLVLIPSDSESPIKTTVSFEIEK